MYPGTVSGRDEDTVTRMAALNTLTPSRCGQIRVQQGWGHLEQSSAGRVTCSSSSLSQAASTRPDVCAPSATPRPGSGLLTVRHPRAGTGDEVTQRHTCR